MLRDTLRARIGTLRAIYRTARADARRANTCDRADTAARRCGAARRAYLVALRVEAGSALRVYGATGGLWHAYYAVYTGRRVARVEGR